MAEQAAPLSEDQSSASTNVTSSTCLVCNESMNEGQDCLLISHCQHSFHRECIESHLSTSGQCPVCQHPCELNELRSYVVTPKRQPVSKQAKRGKGRGAMARGYNTRSASRNLFQDMQNVSFNNEINPQPDPQQGESQINNSINNDNFRISPFTTNTRPASTNSATVDYAEINRMIESNITRILQNLNLSQIPMMSYNNNNLPQIPITSYNNSNSQPINTNNLRENNTLYNISHSNGNFPNQNRSINPNSIPNSDTNAHGTVPQCVQFSGYSQNSNSTSHTTNHSNIHADKVTSIINNWNLKFDGSTNGLTINEFLYRVKTLTNETFDGDFSVICKNFNTLLAGKAREWYWRYRKTVDVISWEDFCKAIRSQYKDMKSSFDIREELRNRKQRPGETYDNFFDALSMIADRLPRPIVEEELIGIIARNLRPEIRQDLLYVPIESLSHLRKLVQMRENFLNDDYVRKALGQRNQIPQSYPRRTVAEVEHEDPLRNTEAEYLFEVTQKNNDFTYKCWNCDKSGHHWQDCLESRTIFCYGCGSKNVYKPQCAKCIGRNATNPKNLRPMGPPKD